MAEGRRVVVDIDLEKFFDRVNHDILMSPTAPKTDLLISFHSQMIKIVKTIKKLDIEPMMAFQWRLGEKITNDTINNTCLPCRCDIAFARSPL